MRGLGQPGCSCRPCLRISSMSAHDPQEKVSDLQNKTHKVSICHPDRPVRFILSLLPLQFSSIQHTCPRASSRDTEVVHNVQTSYGVIDAWSLSTNHQLENNG